MKEEHIKSLIEKYKSGTSSLEEENLLFADDTIEDKSMNLLSKFMNNNKKETPENFNEKLWESFEKKTKKPNKFIPQLIAVAASIALIVPIFINNNSENRMSVSEKEALLNEAKSMFVASNENEQKYDVVFENELVVVYTKPK